MFFLAELGLGEAIGKVVQIEVNVNAAIENYRSETSRLFFENVFTYYGIFEERLKILDDAARATENETKLFMLVKNFHDELFRLRKMAIQKFLNECSKIVNDEEKRNELIQKYFKETGAADARSDKEIVEAIVEMMIEIRTIEEESCQ